MVNRAKDLIYETRLKIMELPYFEKKVEVIAALLDIEWSLKEEKQDYSYIYEDEMAEEVFGDREEPWN